MAQTTTLFGGSDAPIPLSSQIAALRAIRNQYPQQSLAAQTARLFEGLRAFGVLSTFQAKYSLHIEDPGARVRDLRGAGHDVRFFPSDVDIAGGESEVGRYILVHRAALPKLGGSPAEAEHGANSNCEEAP